MDRDVGPPAIDHSQGPFDGSLVTGLEDLLRFRAGKRLDIEIGDGFGKDRSALLEESEVASCGERLRRGGTATHLDENFVQDALAILENVVASLLDPVVQILAEACEHDTVSDDLA